MARTLIKLAGFGPANYYQVARPSSIKPSVNDKHALQTLETMYNALPSDFRHQLSMLQDSERYLSWHNTPDALDSKYERAWGCAYQTYDQLRNLRGRFRHRCDPWSKTLRERNGEEIKEALRQREFDFPSHGDYNPNTLVRLAGQDPSTDPIAQVNSSYRTMFNWSVTVPLTYAKKPVLRTVPLQWLQRNGKKYMCLVTDIRNPREDTQLEATVFDCQFFAFNKSQTQEENDKPRTGVMMFYETSDGNMINGFGESEKKARSLLNRRLKAMTMEALENAW